MDALLSFCKSGWGSLTLLFLAAVLIQFLGWMVLTTALRRLIRFVKDAWE